MIIVHMKVGDTVVINGVAVRLEEKTGRQIKCCISTETDPDIELLKPDKLPLKLHQQPERMAG